MFQYDAGRAIDFVPPLRQLSDGRFISTGSQRDEIYLWDTAGSFVRTIGRTGKGPGEFTYVDALYIDSEDSVHISDMPGRWHVFDPQLAFSRTNFFNVNQWTDAAFLDNGLVLAGRNAGYPEGPLFFIVDRTGTIVRSFGVAKHVNDTRRIAYREGNTFWATSPTTYTLERWSLSGELLGTIRRDVDWFPPSDAGAQWTSEPIVLNIHLDGNGRLWTTSFLIENILAPTMADKGDWIVEVFDTNTGLLLASERLDSPGTRVPGGFLNDSTIWVNIELENGVFGATLSDVGLIPMDSED